MPETTSRRARHNWTAIVVLILGLAATAFCVWREHKLARQTQTIRWQETFAQLQPIFQNAFGQRFDQLRDAAKTTLRRENYSTVGWSNFLSTVEWQQRFPGMLEVGYAEFNSNSCVVKFASGKGEPVYPAGFELMNVPAIRAAVNKSADAGYGNPSESFPLSSAGNSEHIVVGLMTLPFKEARPGTAAENRVNVRGFIFFALNQQQYFTSLAPQLTRLPVVLRLLADGETPPPKTATQRPFTNAGLSGEWRLVATMKSPLAPATAQWIVLIAGIGLSFLLFRMFTTEDRLRFEAETSREQLLLHESEILALNRGLEKRIAERTAELREVNARLTRFAAVANMTPDLVAMAGLDGSVLFLNNAGRKMIGLAADADLSHMRVPDFYPKWVNELFEREAFPAAMRDGSWSGDVALQHRDGHEIPVSMVGLILRSPDGQPEYMACVVRDVSERRQLEESLRTALANEQELNKLKSNFISMVSHEIRTPLALILSSSEILSRYLDRLTPEKRQRHLFGIGDAVQRMSMLLEDVLMFSRAEAGRLEFKPEPLDLKDFCTRLVDEINSATHHRCPIEVQVPDDADAVGVDESLLRHILTNLLTNAVKYSREGETVWLNIELKEGEAVFRVKDRGIGIPEADVKHLFTPFHRSRNAAHVSGTGLGLVIVQRCVERHGGKLAINSREGEGTEATVHLPVYAPGRTEVFKRLQTT